MKVIHNKDSTLYFSQRLWRSVSKYVFSSNCFRFLATVWKEFRIWSKRRYKNPYNLALQKICIKNEKGSRYGPFNIINYQEILLLPSLIEITLPNGCSFVDLKYDLMITIFWKQPWEPTGVLLTLQILTYISICLTYVTVSLTLQILTYISICLTYITVSLTLQILTYIHMSLRKQYHVSI